MTPQEFVDALGKFKQAETCDEADAVFLTLSAECCVAIVKHFESSRDCEADLQPTKADIAIRTCKTYRNYVKFGLF